MSPTTVSPTQFDAALRRATGAPPLQTPPVSKGNQLGASLQPTAPTATKPTVETIVARYRTGLCGSADVRALREAIAEIAEQQRIADEHSPVLVDSETRRLADVYAASPTPKNFDALRHSRTLTPQDHVLVIQHTVIKIRTIIAGVSGESLKVVRKAAELLGAEIAGLEKHDRIHSDAWGVAHVDSARLAGMKAMHRDLLNESSCSGDLPHIPEVALELVRQTEPKAAAVTPEPEPEAELAAA